MPKVKDFLKNHFSEESLSPEIKKNQEFAYNQFKMVYQNLLPDNDIHTMSVDRKCKGMLHFLILLISKL